MRNQHFERGYKMTTEPWALEGVEVARLITSKQLSAAEVAESHINRINDVNKKLNAVVVRTDAEARARAQEVDNGNVNGPLAGVAITPKSTLTISPIRWTTEFVR